MSVYVQPFTLIVGGAAFTSEWFEPDNHFIEGMTVINNRTQQYSTDGYSWFDIETDHL